MWLYAASRAAARPADDLARGDGATGSDSGANGRDGTGAVACVGGGAPPELRRHGMSPPRREWGSRPVGDVVTPDGFGGSTANARIVRQQRRQAARHFN